MLEIPENQREAARDAIRQSRLTKPDRFSFVALFWLLAHPYDSDRKPIQVMWADSRTLYVARIRRAGWFAERPLIFIRGKEKWSVSSHNFNGVFYPGRALEVE